MPAINNPFEFDPAAYEQSQANLQASFDAAGNAVSAASRDTAAARVRARTANQTRGQVEAIRTAGGRNVGQQSALMEANRRASASALATGVADVEEAYAAKQLEAAGIQGTIATGQGTLANLLQQTGIASNVAKANELIGIMGAETDRLGVTGELELGKGELELGQAKLAEEERKARQEELLNFFTEFGRIGATESEQDIFNPKFQELINNLFGGLGIDLPSGGGGGGGDGTIPQPSPEPVGPGGSREGLTPNENAQVDAMIEAIRGFQPNDRFTTVQEYSDYLLLSHPEWRNILVAEGVI